MLWKLKTELKLSLWFLSGRLTSSFLKNWGFILRKFAYNSIRNQHNSTSILKYLLTQLTDYDRLLAIADVDLFAYGLNFVFGEADVLHKMAIISLTRLRQEFYGLPLLFLFLGGGKLIRASFSIRSIATRQLISFNFPSGLNHCN